MRLITGIFVLLTLSACDFLQVFDEKESILLEIDSQWVVQSRFDELSKDLRIFMRNKKLPYHFILKNDEALILTYKPLPDVDLFFQLQQNFPEYLFNDYIEVQNTERRKIKIELSDSMRTEFIKKALKDNVDVVIGMLGALNIMVTRKIRGMDRFEIEIAKSRYTQQIQYSLSGFNQLGFYLVADDEKPYRLIVKDNFQKTVYLKRENMISGKSVVKATVSSDNHSGQPALNIELNAIGAEKMRAMTEKNIGKRIAVLLIHHEFGEIESVGYDKARVLSIATIRGVFGKRFMISGLDDFNEAEILAIYLRVGALTAPIRIVGIGLDKPQPLNKQDTNDHRKYGRTAGAK